jgi:hypothetical protein
MDYFGARKKSVQKRTSKNRAKSAKRIGCVEQFTKKYTSRPSPSYPANECCYSVKTGNDGKRYVSKPNIKGICTWKRL